MSEHPAPRVLFHVQHLLGTGHLRRVAAIARECAEAGATVRVAIGPWCLDGLGVGEWREVAREEVGVVLAGGGTAAVRGNRLRR